MSDFLIDDNWKIGNVNINGRLVLAPMAGVTDLPFRMLCKEYGADLLYTEMVSAKGVFYKSKNTWPLMATDEMEHPIALQLFGSEPEIMGEMAAKIEEELETGTGIAEKTGGGNIDIFDINMGCPVNKVVNNGEGSALMKNIPLAAEIVEAMVKRVNKPVIAKIRKGFKKDEETAVDMAKALEQAGASAIAVHGRTREQFYSGEADYDIIRKVKEAVSIPVIGNGDIEKPEDCKRMFEETGCDAFMIGRAARGNPWIFKQIKHYYNTGEHMPKPDLTEVKDMIIRHATMLTEFKGETMAIREMRTHFAWYTAGYPNSAAMRREINKIESLEDLKKFVR